MSAKQKWISAIVGLLVANVLAMVVLIVAYDATRGEPRGKAKKKLPVVPSGDCVDCAACVAVCPTGIDIREGLQMECVGCAQCIDACDGVMTKLAREPGLIRYTSQDELAGKPRRVLRARTVIYPAILVLAIAGLAWKVEDRAGTEVWIERIQGPSFVALPDGQIASQVQIKLENESDRVQHYRFAVVGAADAALRSAQPEWQAKARGTITVPLFVDAPASSFVRGERRVTLKIAGDDGFERDVTVTLLGPDGGAR